MSSSLLLPELVDAVSPTAVQRYAKSRGWVRLNDPRLRDIALYHRPDSRSTELLVPQSREYRDYVRRMMEALLSLAEFEGKRVADVLASVMTPSSDVFRLRLDIPHAQIGTLPLNEGVSFFSGARNALSVAAYDEISPQRYHPRMSRAEADAFIQNCKLGQTDQGSFVATVLCSLEPGNMSQDQLDLFSDPELRSFESYARRVTTRFMRALEQTVKFISIDEVERLITPADGDLTISANFMEALLELPLAGEHASLDVSCTWASGIPEPNVPHVVRFLGEYFPTIDKVARELRPEREPKEGAFIGKVEALKRRDDTPEQSGGEVTVHLLTDEDMIHARVELSPEDYKNACDAHKLRKYVKLSGTLALGARISRFSGYHSFEVLED